MPVTSCANFDLDTQKLFSAATQIATFFNLDEPEVRPEFLMIAICGIKGGVIEGLFDYVTSEVLDFKLMLLACIADSYEVKLPEIARKLQHATLPNIEKSIAVDKRVEQIMAEASKDWLERNPKTKKLVPIDYFLGAMLLYTENFEVLDLALMQCDFDREDMFSYLMLASDILDKKYPGMVDLGFDSFDMAQDFYNKTMPNKTETKKSPKKYSSLEVEKHLRRTIIGQNEAISVVMRAIKANDAGLKDPIKPIGMFLFTGLTGVGKTELARQLSVASGMPILRLDMSEYGEKHSVMRLYGAPPSYVGYDEGGQLTNFVSKNPNSIVVLDEIEKAHPDTTNILLQIAEEGTLTDGKGNIVSLNQTIIILTTNIGSRDAAKTPLGFGDNHIRNQKQIFMSATNDFFKPELRGRLSSIIVFEQLSPEGVLQIAKLELKKLSDRMQANRGMQLKASVAVRQQIADTSDVIQFGARNIKSVIARDIGEPLADYILANSLQNGTAITVSFNQKNGYHFSHKNSP